MYICTSHNGEIRERERVRVTQPPLDNTAPYLQVPDIAPADNLARYDLQH
jgi:hypothetical protein